MKTTVPRHLLRLAALPLLLITLVACGGTGDAPSVSETIPTLTPANLEPGEKLRVVATTSIIGDVVAQVGGDAIDLIILIAPGIDPHGYEPAPQDIVQIEGAHVVFSNGLGLEQGLLDTIRVAGKTAPLVPVSAGVEVIESPGIHGGDQPHAAADPHTWMDPHNVVIWVENISAVLSQLDPPHAQDYASRAVTYTKQLKALDAYIQEQVDRIPLQNRKLVTNHEALGYFARRYGFEVLGAVYIGASTLSEPTAGDMAQLLDLIKAEGVRAIFVETTASDKLAQAIAKEAGYEIAVYTLYTGSLGEPGSGADSYIGMMRANIDTIVAGLGS